MVSGAGCLLAPDRGVQRLLMVLAHNFVLQDRNKKEKKNIKRETKEAGRKKEMEVDIQVYIPDMWEDLRAV